MALLGLSSYGVEMPFKHHVTCRHHTPRARYRVLNWPAYEAKLRRRGDLTLWLDQAALAGWAAPRRTTPGGHPPQPFHPLRAWNLRLLRPATLT